MNTSTSDPREDPQWELVRAAAKRPVPTPAGLVSRVFRSVQGVRGRLLSSPLELEVDGDRLSVTERTLVLLTRRLTQEEGQELGGIHLSAVALDQDELQVLVTIDYGVSAVDTAETLRTNVSRELIKQLGTSAPPVNVHVIDVRQS